MHRYVSISGLLVCLVACRGPGEDVTAVRIATAERFFRGVYGCDSSVVDELASDDVVVSYPIFKTIFATSSIRGRAAVRKFASGFCERWAEPHITIHESVGDEDKVVLVWSFRARNVGSARQGIQPTHQEHSWGGITLYRFDKNGKIVAEIGEESEPGPIQRLSDETPHQ